MPPHALRAIIADYNASYLTNHSIDEFDAYYQDVQKRIKDQQYPNHDLPKKGAEKIDEVDYTSLEVPPVIRRNPKPAKEFNKAPTNKDMEYLDIPAFLRRQAD